ncbi:thioredoxin family protein [bacterium]|nr:thioredoxin family protein [bacterium]
MSKTAKAIILAVVLLAVAGALVLKQRSGAEGGSVARDLPRLVDLGADKCVPCRMMAPVLEELRTECRGRLDVVFIDVWKDRGAGEKYGISVIPTQVFFDPEGRELFRHEGFISKADILAKWAELGYSFN